MKKPNILCKVEMLILCILKQQDCYGYIIAKKIYEYSDNNYDIKLGTIYPILRQLNKSGAISSSEKVIDNKIRVYYHLEPAGLEILNNLIEEYKNAIKTIDKIIDRCQKQ